MFAAVRGAPARSVERFRHPLIALALGLVAFGVYWRSNPSPIGWYEHFVYQADAFLHGRLDLVGTPSYYVDLAPYRDKFYLPMPPGPALVLLPLVAVFGVATALEAHAAIALGALDVALGYWAFRRVGASTRSAVFGALLLGFSSVMWSAAALGTAWFFAHLVAIAAVLLALGELAGPRRGALVGLCFALGWLARAPLLFTAPFAFLFLWRTRSHAQALAFALVAIASVGAYGLFDQARFDDPWETGERLHSPATSLSSAKEQGLFAPVHVPANVGALLLRGFDVVPEAPYFKPSPEGLSILFTTPALLALLFPRRRYRRVEWLALACAACVLLPSLFWFSSGWVQWGYRYALDSLPFALVALLLAHERGPRAVEWLLLAIGAAVDLLGIYWIRTLGW